MEEKYCLRKLNGKDIFKILDENRDKIDEYFWTYYENFTSEILEEYISDLCNFIKPFGNMLSIGCGHGLNEVYIHDMCRDVKNIKGIDVKESKIKSMNKIIDLLGLENIDGSQANGMNMDFPDKSFDTVIIIECLSHVDDISQVLKEAARVLKKGGAVLVIDFNNGANPRIWFRSWKQRRFEDVEENIVNPYNIRNELLKIGYKDIIMEPYRHYRSFGYLKKMLNSKDVLLPPRWYLFVSKGFMLKGVKL
jgi:SAM-dependent methyltransferase